MDPTIILAAGVASGTVLLFASVGEIFAERAGVINLGVEGMMLIGAVVGFGTAVASGRSSMSLDAAKMTEAGPTRSACGAGICQLTRSLSCGSDRLQRISTTASPARGCTKGITSRPSSVDTAAVSTTLAGPTSSTSHAPMATTIRDTGAPRTETRSLASSATRVAATS